MSLAVALAAATVARRALLSNQFPPLYDAASGGPHHLTLTPRLVGFIRLVVILCVLRYLGFGLPSDPVLLDIAAHIFRELGWGCGVSN